MFDFLIVSIFVRDDFNPAYMSVLVLATVENNQTADRGTI
jgi:hypothetical protein